MKPPCPPKSDCWCEERPNNPNCITALPIDNKIFTTIILILIIWKIKKNFVNGCEIK